jgi:hypothetical protein
MISENKMRHVITNTPTPSVTHSDDSFFLLYLYLQSGKPQGRGVESQTKYVENPKPDVLGVNH